MSLKHVRENYARLLTAFKDAGVKLTESQKKDMDGFILALESSMESTKQATIKATRKVVEAKLSEEYQKVFESILAHQQEHNVLAGKIQNKITKINESKQLAHAVDGYLETMVKESLPAKKIVDYDRLNKLESVFESLKDTLLVNDASVEEKRKELTESFEADRKELDAKVASLTKKLNESIARERKLTASIESAKAKDLLAKKTKDLPLFEAQQIKRRLANATCEEIEKNYKKLLESVREEMKDACNEEEKTLEEEINDIIAKECSDSDKPAKSKQVSIEEKEADNVEKKSESDAEDDSSSDEEEDDGVELDESEMIPASLMQRWMATAVKGNPIAG